VEPKAFKSRGKNSPFAGKILTGKITMTLHGGRIVYDGCVR
jgi:dihydroorotase-like cyclic amidohydrolase